jgi:hypothetical protein
MGTTENIMDTVVTKNFYTPYYPGYNPVPNKFFIPFNLPSFGNIDSTSGMKGFTGRAYKIDIPNPFMDMKPRRKRKASRHHKK